MNTPGLLLLTAGGLLALRGQGVRGLDAMGKEGPIVGEPLLSKAKGEPEWLLGKPLASCIITEGWGMAREGRSAHGAIDLRAPVGTPVFAAAAGRVRFGGQYADGSGGAVELDHGDGMLTRYLHLSQVAVKTGAIVTRGQPLGQSGFAKSPHLHFDVSVLPPQVEFYKARFSDAKFLGAITIKPGGVTRCKVPVEPLIAADGYQDDVVKAARLYAVRVREGVAIVA